MKYLPLTAMIIAIQLIMYIHFPMDIVEGGWESIVQVVSFVFIQFMLFATSVSVANANSNKEPKQ